MIDPIHSLAFSIQANRGVYAVLVGSGISRAAEIPTGWEITLDLVRKLATLRGETAEPDPEAWYREIFGTEPDYSDLLENLARTPAERQQLLRSYWEPNEQERTEGKKQPTAAHHAIAALVAQGFIKVIITTNFDQLMERALRDAGVVPNVLSSPDHVQGMLPLIHTQCCVLKLHGDYLDPRIRNTRSELEAYPEEFDQLLDRIFDEFGLIVCGWSATWDNALRNAIERCPSRRFATYWAVRGEPSDAARRLINHRGAEVISIEDADTFFQTVQQHVESIEEFSRPHPLSTEAAVASLKRYLSESKYRIQLSDLIDETVDRIIEATSGEAYSVQGIPINTESATARVRGYEAACSKLLAMAPVGGFWTEEGHYHVWQRALERLSPVNSNGAPFWLSLQCYPGTLLLYALGLGVVKAHRLEFLERLFATMIHRKHREAIAAVQLLPSFCLFSVHSQGGRAARILEGMERNYVPLNNWLHNALRQYAKRVIPSDDEYMLVFDKLEMLMALGYAYRGVTDWVPIGLFGYREENRNRIFQEIEESISVLQERSSFVKSGIFGETVEQCSQSLETFKVLIARVYRW